MNYDAKVAIILLLKGIFYKSDNEKAFLELSQTSHYAIKEYFETIGLDVQIHHDDGYAYLEQRCDEDQAIPSLIPTRELSYKVSLLLVLLRQKIAEFEMQNENERAIVSVEEISTMLELFFEMSFNEVKLQKDLEATIKKVEDLGFLKMLSNGHFEIKSAIKAFIDVAWLDGFDAKLLAYKEAGLWN